MANSDRLTNAEVGTLPWIIEAAKNGDLKAQKYVKAAEDSCCPACRKGDHKYHVEEWIKGGKVKKCQCQECR